MSDSAVLAHGTSDLTGSLPATAGRQERLAALLQFPRRALFLGIAFGLALARLHE